MRRTVIDNLDSLVPETPAEAALTPFERRLGDSLLRSIEHDPRSQAARRQLEGATVGHRQFSGCGLFVNLVIAPDAPPGDPSFIRNGLGSASIAGPGLPSTGAGAAFLATDGRLTCIECYTYDGDWPVEQAMRYLLTEDHGVEIWPGVSTS